VKKNDGYYSNVDNALPLYHSNRGDRRMNCPCRRDCPDREGYIDENGKVHACHDVCEPYLKYKAELKKTKDMIRATTPDFDEDMERRRQAYKIKRRKGYKI